MKQVGEATIERARVLMSDGVSRSCKEIADALGISHTSGSNAVRALHARKQVYVVHYDTALGNSRRIAIYAIRLANERDASAPKGVSRKGSELVRERVWLAESRATGNAVFRHPFDVWLFGDVAPIAPSKIARRIIRQDMTGESLEAR